MSTDLLQKFFGTNPQQQQDYTDFIQRYQNDPNSISDQEAARRYREMLRHAPQDMAAEAHDQAFQQLSPQDRGQLADSFRNATQDPNRPYDGYKYDDPNKAADPSNIGRMSHQAEQQDPDLMDQLLGKNSPLNSTLGRAALAGAAAYIASRVLSGKGINAPGGGLPNIFGGHSSGTPGASANEVGGFDKKA